MLGELAEVEHSMKDCQAVTTMKLLIVLGWLALAVSLPSARISNVEDWIGNYWKSKYNSLKAGYEYKLGKILRNSLTEDLGRRYRRYHHLGRKLKTSDSNVGRTIQNYYDSKTTTERYNFGRILEKPSAEDIIRDYRNSKKAPETGRYYNIARRL